MSAFLARVLLTVSLLFGSVVVPAMAGGEAAHSMEIIDGDCDVPTASAEAGGQAPGTPDKAPALHIDHHHCSACTEVSGRPQSSGLFAAGNFFFGGPATILASRATAPPTQPPAA
ncbi:hypothetical protein FHR22_002977 [Sphingopyxis panaciterrae]|uniref:hypothetical protein n=1 Tax=Sphingopyxis panaciterrae TaxID=363841 RepID=UPI00142170C7|nr:hypothetical protein [Sphingopyxis panaciterrae]NIJ38266.1 hypothetical protein [Sphingopyxis panaciterrae]